ncbi:MAG: ArsR family transcriptional regulator [Gallionella sp.]|nr:ArsR family transcriptional regulator [Gallionella sp.]
MNVILQYMKMNGEKFDQEIAIATGIPLASVRLQLAELTATNEIVACQSIRFNKGKKSEGTIYRIAGYSPPASPGRKPNKPKQA